MPKEKLYEDMLFDYETSHRTYYCDGEIQPIIKTVYKPKPTCYRIRPPPLKLIHTLADWKDAKVPPFYLLHTPKDIVQTNPWKPQQPYDKTKDVDREQAQKTRPRLVMTPAVSMDDISDPRARDILCSDMYRSEMSRVTRAALAAIPRRVNVRAPLPSLPAPANPVALPKLQPAYVSPEWRMDSTTWDNRQLRGHCDQTKEFWLRREPMKCSACDVTAARDLQRKLKKQIRMKP